MLGEGSERLHAGHEVRQANVRRRPDYPREGAEHPHPSGGGDVHQGDRGQRFVSDTLIPHVVRFVSEHPHPSGGGDVHQGDKRPEVCIRAPLSRGWCQRFVWVSQPPLAGHVYRFFPKSFGRQNQVKKEWCIIIN